MQGTNFSMGNIFVLGNNAIVLITATLENEVVFLCWF